MAIRVGINGFGRTGRALLRAAARTELDIEVVAVNDLAAPGALARLLARDSVHGRYGAPVSVDGSVMLVGDARITMLSEPDVKALPWSEHQVDVVVECTVGSPPGRRRPSTSMPVLRGWSSRLLPRGQTPLS